MLSNDIPILKLALIKSISSNWSDFHIPFHISLKLVPESLQARPQVL
jgi:hypothetical protein